MICTRCNASRHSQCTGKGTWCDCCGSNAKPVAATSRSGSAGKGGRRRSARSAPAPRPKRTAPTCLKDGCDQPVKGLGLCGMHWQRLYRHGDTDIVDHGGRKTKASAEDVDEIVLLYRQGLTQQEVAEHFDHLNRNQVRYVLAKEGLLDSQA